MSVGDKKYFILCKTRDTQMSMKIYHGNITKDRVHE